jgi:hypothetical protein
MSLPLTVETLQLIKSVSLHLQSLRRPLGNFNIYVPYHHGLKALGVNISLSPESKQTLRLIK